MSLIQEALKRQQEETDGVPAAAETTPQPPPLAARPPPPPLPDTVKAEGEKERPRPPLTGVVEPAPASKTRTWPILIAVLLLVLLLGGGGIWMLWIPLRNFTLSGGKPSSAVEKSTPAAVTPAPASVTPEPAPPAAPEPAEPEPVEPVEPVELAEPPPSAVTPTPAVAEPNTATVQTAEPEWPSLSLTAIVGRGVTGSAIINGTIVSVGESIDGVMLVIIGDQSVEIEFEGMQRSLRVGHSTD